MNSTQNNTLITVKSVYGHKHRVLKRQLDDPHTTQLALFTAKGKHYSDYRPGHPIRTGGVTLHRENIAEILGVHDHEARPNLVHQLRQKEATK